ncbi:mechanosensitive ion channel family protein [Occallatibacter riparius]|uniref:Mechanosensitive ion channel family protein n=1 Tax=Occallatibacter riparius TaxID=1002689 RepID=A0A9J7BN40_9BACT|nr:mechanosensitive ion channel family protein [Occallatibacter riparius]UWZ83178.1 mechanosensitive ion channel family protein [Occallatibacter riparius]
MGRALLVLLFAASLSIGADSELSGQQAPRSSSQKQGTATEAKSPSHEPSNAAGSEQAAHGSAPGQPTAPKEITALHLEQLPKPLPRALTEGIDVNQRSQVILAHLNEAIKFYRMTATPIQKTGEPSDMLYGQQAQSTATQATQLAFQSARDEAALLARIQGATGKAAEHPQEAEAQRLQSAQMRIAQRVRELQATAADLDQQIAKSTSAQRADLEDQKTDVMGQLELAAAEQEALAKVAGISVPQTNSQLQSEIDKLQSAVPEVIDNKVKPVANTMESLGSLRDAGVVTQGQVLFQLMGTLHAIDQRIAEVKRLHEEAQELRTPLVNILRATVKQGQKMQAGASGGEDSSQVPNGEGPPPHERRPVRGVPGPGAPSSNSRAELRKKYDELTDAFKTISGVSVPIGQEILLLEQAQGNFISWRAAVDAERIEILHALLIRLVLIAAVLMIVFIVGEVWRRAVMRYVQDLRRRRQLLVVRRMVIGFMSAVVILLGFVTQFSSLATFAGFISAGIAVGLQTVLLSVAAYFFIVGRYGVKVGDRITVANVTGDVVEVGLARFYMLELAGTGVDLHPTGRVAVFANSVLFQTGTPLYKQIPGTSYAWHEVVVKLKPGTDYEPALKSIRGAVQTVYDEYCEQMERQHAETEAWMDTAVPKPRVEARLQLADGLQYSVLYPVPMGRAAETDQKVTQSVLDAMGHDAATAQAVDGQPTLKAVVKS